MTDEDRVNPFVIHGIIMWVVWTLLSFSQIALNRYLKSRFWKKSHKYHILIGICMFILCTIMSLYALHSGDWKIDMNAHFYFAFPAFLGTAVVVLFGCLTKCNSLSGKWNTNKSLKMRKIHRFLGYLFIIIGQGGIFTGINKYCKHRDCRDYHLDYIQLALFVVLMLLAEFLYQRFLQKEVVLCGSK